LQVLEVGKLFELFYGRNMKGQDGCIFERFKDGSEYCLVVYMSNMSEKERELLRFSKITVKIIKEGDFILTLIRYGNTELYFEINFDPMLYKDGRMDNLLKSNMIYIVGVESNSNIIMNLRYVNMPMKLLGKYVTVWDNAKYVDSYSKRYKRWVDDLDSRYSVLELWDIGVYIGKIGE